MSTLRRNTHEANYHRQLRRIGLLIDYQGVPADHANQGRASGRLREVGVRPGMRNRYVHGLTGRRQAGNVNPDHVDGQGGGEAPAGELAGWRLRSRPYLLQELDEAASSELDRGQIYRRIGIDVIDLRTVHDQALERGSRG